MLDLDLTPREVSRALILLWMSFALELGMFLAYPVTFDEVALGPGPGLQIAFFVVKAAAIFLIYRQFNWARYAYLVGFVASFVPIFPNLLEVFMLPNTALAFTLSAAAQILALVLLFRESSTAWFHAPRI